MSMQRTTLILAAASLLGGCQTARYEWGQYDRALYKYYKEPENRSALKDELEGVFALEEAGQGKVAPGLYAEYGYLLLEEGKPDEAVLYFQMEKQAWPESATLMTRMIAVCKGNADSSLTGNQERSVETGDAS